jgi:hypothetical protein
MKGGGKLHTKHLHARMHLGKEMVDEGMIQLMYKNAEGMKADGLSKPYYPAKHAPFAALIQGNYKRSQQVGSMQTVECNNSDRDKTANDELQQVTDKEDSENGRDEE